MKTEIISNLDVDGLKQIKQSFNLGMPVVVPSETVYGLAAPYNNLDAVNNIFVVKNRPQDNPLIVHISSLEQLDKLVKVESFSKACSQLMDEFWPGPLTILFEKSELVDDLVTAGSNLVAVRMPSHPIFKQIIDFVGVPIVAPSANLSGKPSPTNASDCFEDLDGRVGIIVDGGQCDFGLESTVIKFTTDNSVKILRPGFVTEKDLSQFVDVEIDDSVLESVISSSETKVESPGMKYKHYSPAAKVEIIYDLDLKSLVLNEKEYLVCFSQLNLDLDEKVLNFKSEDELARNLFSTFRNLDRLNASKIYIEFPKENLALQNRILKATG